MIAHAESVMAADIHPGHFGLGSQNLRGRATGGFIARRSLLERHDRVWQQGDAPTRYFGAEV